MTSKQYPQLQLAIDVLTEEDAMAIAEQVYPFFDIAEIGTPLIIEQGLSPLKQLKQRFPDKRYLADVKIMDAGRIEATSAFRAGSEIATVIAAADDKTIIHTVDSAVEFGGQIMADLINVADCLERARQLEALGVHILCLHTAYDRQADGIDPLADLVAAREAVDCPLAVAGGLNLHTVEIALEKGADIVIVGGAIHKQPNPRQAAEEIYRLVERMRK